MARGYRPVARDQVFLLPPDMREWLPQDHLAWFVLEIVEQLDRSALHRQRSHAGAGRPSYDPDMLLAVVIYAYCQGVRSSRQIERMCVTDVAFRVLCSQDGPDHTTIARFRADAGAAFTDLFAQVLMIAAQAGLGRFGTVAIDGTKIAANASIDANRGPEWFTRHAAGIVAEADRTDAAEDTAAEAQDEDRQDRVSKLGDRTQRAERIRQAADEVAAVQQRRARASEEHQAAALERRQKSESGQPVRGRIPHGPHRLAEARAHLAREVAAHQAKLDRYAALIAAGKKPMGRPPVSMEASSRVQRARRVFRNAEAAAEAAATEDEHPASSAKQVPKVVANTTDPASRIMPTRKGFQQGYNAQFAVSSDQLIIAVHLGQSTNDQHCFIPMMNTAQQVADRLHARTGRTEHEIGTVLADAGYNNDANLAATGPDRLIAVGKRRDQTRAAIEEPAHGPPPADAHPREANTHRLHTEEGQALYKQRGATAEPGIGNLKKIINQFSRRGLNNATSELHLAATAFNLMKIHRHTPAT